MFKPFTPNMNRTSLFACEFIGFLQPYISCILGKMDNAIYGNTNIASISLSCASVCSTVRVHIIDLAYFGNFLLE